MTPSLHPCGTHAPAWRLWREHIRMYTDTYVQTWCGVSGGAIHALISILCDAEHNHSCYTCTTVGTMYVLCRSVCMYVCTYVCTYICTHKSTSGAIWSKGMSANTLRLTVSSYNQFCCCKSNATHARTHARTHTHAHTHTHEGTVHMHQ